MQLSPNTAELARGWVSSGVGTWWGKCLVGVGHYRTVGLTGVQRSRQCAQSHPGSSSCVSHLRPEKQKVTSHNRALCAMRYALCAVPARYLPLQVPTLQDTWGYVSSSLRIYPTKCAQGQVPEGNAYPPDPNPNCCTAERGNGCTARGPDRRTTQARAPAAAGADDTPSVPLARGWDTPGQDHRGGCG